MNLIVFHPPCIDYNVSKEVLSQYDFLKNAKHILEKNNINLLYFYELLPPEQAKKYYDLEENFKYSFDELTLEQFYKKDLPYLKNLIENDKEKYSVHCFESGNYLKINCKKMIYSMYDWHGWNKLKYMDGYTKFYRLNVEYHELERPCLANLDLLISPTVQYIENIKSKYAEKAEFIPFSYNSNNKQIFELQDFDNYFNRERKILMSGATSVYSHRKIITCLKKIPTNHIYKKE